jgi:hypothetical protein
MEKGPNYPEHVQQQTGIGEDKKISDNSAQKSMAYFGS